jgi:hypothetical protein
VGVDRDLDGFFDRDELDAGSDPADPGSIPPGGTTTTTTTTVPGSTTTTTTLPVPSVQITATSFKMGDDSSPPINLRKRKLRFKSTTKNQPPANQIVIPAPGGNGDPTDEGAELIVYNTAGGPEFVFVSLDPLGWEQLGSPSNPSGYKFTGADPNGPVQKIIVRNNKLTIKGGRDNWPYTLDEPSQGSVGIRLTLGTGVRWCAEGGKPLPAFAPKKDQTDKFSARRKTPAPVVCPPLPGGSPSRAFLEMGGGLLD